MGIFPRDENWKYLSYHHLDINWCKISPKSILEISKNPALVTCAVEDIRRSLVSLRGAKASATALVAPFLARG